MPDGSSGTSSSSDRVAGLTALLLGGAAVMWWSLMPGGFAWNHPRFWANRAIPMVAASIAAAAIVDFKGARSALIASLPAAWSAAILSWFVVFPISGRMLAPSVIALTLALWWQPLRAGGWRQYRRTTTIACCLVLSAFGAAWTWTQRAPLPDTRPLNLPMPVTASGATEKRTAIVQLGSQMTIGTENGAVVWDSGALRIEARPLLEFNSRSPDRCWSNLAPPRQRIGPRLGVASFERSANHAAISYERGPDERLRLTARSEAGAAVVETWAALDRPVYSHLNTFCELHLAGHSRLQLCFSPCPDVVIDALPSDYPVGRPGRLAYLDAAEGFHVVEASSGEKGPFRQLASGRLRSSDPLAITVYDGQARVCRVTLDDWAAQAGRDVSPTAGWGLPVNAIQFGQIGELPSGPVMIWVTLASTSVGRGWDTVGHTPGVYRNLMRLESFDLLEER